MSDTERDDAVKIRHHLPTQAQRDAARMVSTARVQQDVVVGQAAQQEQVRDSGMER